MVIWWDFMKHLLMTLLVCLLSHATDCSLLPTSLVGNGELGTSSKYNVPNIMFGHDVMLCSSLYVLLLAKLSRSVRPSFKQACAC